jgi:hypothetical protein
MHASITEATRPFQLTFGEARQKGRRNRSRLRYYVSLVASGATAFGRGLLWALQDARSREAARVIDRYRHLHQDFGHVGGSHCPKEAGTEVRQIKATED